MEPLDRFPDRASVGRKRDVIAVLRNVVGVGNVCVGPSSHLRDEAPARNRVVESPNRQPDELLGGHLGLLDVVAVAHIVLRWASPGRSISLSRANTVAVWLSTAVTDNAPDVSTFRESLPRANTFSTPNFVRAV
jgi:hypothetical protein